MFFKLMSVTSVKTACVCIVFFFHYLKYYGQSIFSRTTALYLIALKLKEKNKLFIYNMKLSCIRKKRERKFFRLRQ